MNNFYLTRRAFTDIQKIYAYSQTQWGESKADQYIANIYKAFNKLANISNPGELRKTRSTPFLMYPCDRHYIVYETFNDGIIIITILHQVRNIENIIQEFGSTFFDEIESLKTDINWSFN
jgi:toxin ParE1/3/4